MKKMMLFGCVEAFAVHEKRRLRIGLEAGNFAVTEPEDKDRAATTWTKEAINDLRDRVIQGNEQAQQEIYATLEEVQGISASEWQQRLNLKAGGSDKYIVALQGALKILHQNKPDKFLDPGVIDGVYANVKDGRPDLAGSNTAAAMEKITGKRYIDQNSIGEVKKAFDEIVITPQNTAGKRAPAAAAQAPAAPPAQGGMEVQQPDASGEINDLTLQTVLNLLKNNNIDPKGITQVAGVFPSENGNDTDVIVLVGNTMRHVVIPEVVVTEQQKEQIVGWLNPNLDIH